MKNTHRPYDDSIILKIGDLLEIEDRKTHYENWIWAVKQDGEKGWVPESYVERLSASTAKAIRNYCSRELAVKKGDLVEITNNINGWAEVKRADGDIGWIPETIMGDHLTTYWALRLDRCRQSLEDNNFSAYIASDAKEAGKIVIEKILPEIAVKTVSWGDSLTLYATAILDDIRRNPDIRLLETFAENVPREELIERRRQALLSDLFFTGSNAVTETGALVNLDMIGNRTGAITFGPLHVVILAGRNKIVPDVETAMKRIKAHAAPANAIRHPGLKTPCIKTARCMDCKSPDRICNTWTITQKSFPKGRIRVVLINEDLGL